MPQKQNYFAVWAAWATQFIFILKLYWVGLFFHKFLTKFLTKKSPLYLPTKIKK
jgi:hypothetical protein